MPQLFRSCTIIACVLSCLILLAAGCGKKRIYTEPVPPGAHVPAGARVPATATPKPAATPAPVATTPVEAPAKAEAAKALEPIQLGDELPSEAEPLSGKAGMVDDALIGFPMADGSSYDADLLVAGHRTLPLGTKLEVTNIATGKRVIVTVVDRGPFDQTRIIDLSHAAAMQLGMEGVTEVALKVVGGGMVASQEMAKTSQSDAPASTKTVSHPAAQSQATTKVKTAHDEPFYVQVGAFEDAANAKIILNKLIQDGMAGSRLVEGTEALSRVQAGPFASRAAAEKALNELRTVYPASFIVTPD